MKVHFRKMHHCVPRKTLQFEFYLFSLDFYVPALRFVLIKHLFYFRMLFHPFRKLCNSLLTHINSTLKAWCRKLVRSASSFQNLYLRATPCWTFSFIRFLVPKELITKSNIWRTYCQTNF